MRRFYAVVVFVMMLSGLQVQAQNYLTLGGGLTGYNMVSDDLATFKLTYNNENIGFLYKLFEGFGYGVGPRFSLGYRHVADWFNAGVIYGYHRNKAIDNSSFTNGDNRNLELAISGSVVEVELGLSINEWLLNGLIVNHFGRHLKLTSKYKGTGNETAVDRLSGTYQADVNYVMDLGVSLAFIKEPFILSGKLTYPVKKQSDKPLLTGDGITVFPEDYYYFLRDESFIDGLGANIDGLKLVFDFSYAFKF